MVVRRLASHPPPYNHGVWSPVCLSIPDATDHRVVKVDVDPAVQVFLLQIKASLENVAKISLPDGHEYCLDVAPCVDNLSCCRALIRKCDW